MNVLCILNTHDPLHPTRPDLAYLTSPRSPPPPAPPVSPVGVQATAADAQVEAGSDEARRQLEGATVGRHRLLRLVPVCQRSAQLVPQLGILRGEGQGVNDR